ncbi:hypothetical protein ACIG54_36300 [Streptomyces achromogenes]|uniref:hypothetical protein n=1 Tax=Streptomyces achromogenes TaxID=67255 RepID=UPI0037CE773A
MTGLLVGMVFDVLLDRVAGVGWGAAAGLVSWLITTWSASPADLTAVTSPRQLLRQDHKAFWTFVRTGALLGLLTGLLLGVLLGILNWDLWEVDLADELVRNTISCCCIGLWSGLVLGLAAAVHRTATGEFALTRLYLAVRNRDTLPRHLMDFLADAHQVRGVPRQAGPIYQFCHVDLQRHLARRT